MPAIPIGSFWEKFSHLPTGEFILSNFLHIGVLYSGDPLQPNHKSINKVMATDLKTLNGQQSLKDPGIKALSNSEVKGIWMQEIQREIKAVVWEHKIYGEAKNGRIVYSWNLRSLNFNCLWDENN